MNRREVLKASVGLLLGLIPIAKYVDKKPIAISIRKDSKQQEANDILAKWEKTGLLDGLNGEMKTNLAMILDNQARELRKKIYG